MQKGFFLTLEGPDGCGKSTQTRLLADFLKSQDYEVLLTREPGGTPLAEEIRNVILTPSQEPLDPIAEILLYTAARAQHVNTLIKPALASGKVVICERFIHSSLAYQGYGLGWDLEFIRAINRMAVGEFQPDLTFLFDMDAGESLKRVANRNGAPQKPNVDRIEARGVSFQEKVRRGFLELARDDPGIILINSSQRSIKDIHSQLTEILTAKVREQGLNLERKCSS